MKFIFVILFCYLATAEIALAQDTPAASASLAPSGVMGLDQNGGTLHYALGVSETIITGYGGGGSTARSTNFTGSASLVTNSKTKPTSLIYSGGYLLSETSGQPSAIYQDLGLSQVMMTKHWNFAASDFVSYLPASPTTGLSGTAGVGDLNTVPAGTFTGDNILSFYSTRIGNNANASAEGKLTGSTSIEASGSYGIQRFLGSLGTNNSNAGGSIGLQHRLGNLSTLGGNYTYSRFEYGPSPTYYTGDFSFISQGVNLTYEHTFSRKLSSSISIGPQWTNSVYMQASPKRINFAADVALNYTGKLSHASLSYYRGTSSGSGILPGVDADNVSFMLQRILNQTWNGAISASYVHTSGIFSFNAATPSTQAFYGGVQVSRKIGRDIDAYLSYTAETQAISGISAAQNAFSGLSQVVGFGLTFSPASIHFGHP